MLLSACRGIGWKPNRAPIASHHSTGLYPTKKKSKCRITIFRSSRRFYSTSVSPPPPIDSTTSLESTKLETYLQTLEDTVNIAAEVDQTYVFTFSWPLKVLAFGTGLIYFVALPFITIPFRNQKLGGGAPYIGTFPNRQRTIFQKLSQFPHLKGKKLVDLGSGDGRIVFEAAQSGFLATGIELNRYLIYYSKANAIRLGLQKRANFVRSDFFEVNLSDYHVVVLYGIDNKLFMQRMREKLEQSLPDDAVVISNQFRIHGWTSYGPVENSVFLYRMCDQKRAAD